MIVRQAITPIEKQRCFEWIRERGYTPSTDLYLYIEKDEKITAVAGLALSVGSDSKIGLIDILLSDDLRASDILYNQSEGFFRALGAKAIICTSSVEKVWTMLERHNYKLWTGLSKQFIKEL